MVTALAVATLHLAAVPVGMTLGTQLRVQAAQGTAVFAELGAALREAGFTPQLLTTDCKGARSCFADRARAEQLAAVVAVSLVGSKRGLAVDAEAIGPDGVVLAQATVALAPADPVAQARPELDRLAAQLARLLAPPPEPVADAPVAAPPPPTLQPVPARPDSALTATAPPPPRSRAPTVVALVLGAGALGTAGATLGFGLSGLGKARAVAESPDGVRSDLTRARAQALVDSANADYSAALGFGLGTAALTVAALAVGLAGL